MGEKNLGQFISKRREFMHLTQDDLAFMVGVSKSAIAKWETNRGIPDRDNLGKLSEAIGVPLSELYRIIDSGPGKDINPDVNITSEVIKVLESYGYKVVPIDEKNNGGGETK